MCNENKRKTLLICTNMSKYIKIRKNILHFKGVSDRMTLRVKLIELLKSQGVKAMEILNITVGGYRNIKKQKLYFDSITALVGLNGYGKSNIMNAIDFGFDFIHHSNNTRTKMMASKENIPILKTNVGQNYSFDIEVKLTSKNKHYYANYGYSFSWETTHSPAKITNEYLNIKEDAKSQKYKAYIVRENNDAKYRSAESGRCSNRIKIDESNLVLVKLMSLDNLYYADIIKQINSIEYFIERHLDASPSFIPDPFIFKNVQELELQGICSIPRAIYYLKKDYEDKYELLINSFKQLFPDVKDIEVHEHKLNQTSKMDFSDDAPFVFSDSIFSMNIIDDKMVQPVNFERLSDGTKRVFLMLTFAVIADIKGLSMIAIEEPENSIHPGLLQSYLNVLSQLINNCKIVITSHSPYMIQYLNPHSIYIGLSSNKGESKFGRIAANKTNTIIKDAAEYDKSVGDYIFNVLSSSDCDEYLKEYLDTDD